MCLLWERPSGRDRLAKSRAEARSHNWLLYENSRTITHWPFSWISRMNSRPGLPFITGKACTEPPSVQVSVECRSILWAAKVLLLVWSAPVAAYGSGFSSDSNCWRIAVIREDSKALASQRTPKTTAQHFELRQSRF